MAVSAVDICNMAMQLLGANFITSLTQDTKEARQCNVAYPRCRDAELRKHPWNFAKTRVILAYEVDTPAFDFDYKYLLPPEYGAIHPDFERYMNREVGESYSVEAGYLLTNFAGPLNFTYTKLETDTTKFDPVFVSALAASIAFTTADAITESNTKKQIAAADYREKIMDARKANAFERPSEALPDSTWVTARYAGGRSNWYPGPD